MYSVQLKLRLSKARNNRKCCRQHCWALPGPVCLHPEVAESLRSSLEAGDVFVVINLMPSEVEAGIGMGCHGSRCSWPWPLLGTKVFAEYHQDFIATLEVAPILYICFICLCPPVALVYTAGFKVSAYRHSCGDGLFKVRFLKPDACIHIRQMQVWPRALYRQVVLPRPR